MRTQEVSYFVSLLVYIGAIAAIAIGGIGASMYIRVALWLLALVAAAIFIVVRWKKSKSLLPTVENYNKKISVGLFFVNCSHIMFLIVIFLILLMSPGSASGIFLLLPGLLWLAAAFLGVSLVELGRRASTKSNNTGGRLA